MPRRINPPAGWTEEQETCIKECFENGQKWSKSTLFNTPEHRRYAKQRFYVHKRRSLSPKPSKSSSDMAPSTKSSIDPKMADLADSMKNMGISRHNFHQLSLGADNPRDMLVGLAEDVKLPNGTTTSAAVVIDTLSSILYHLEVEAKLVEALTAKTKEGGGKATHAIRLVQPTLLKMFKSKHGLDSTDTDQTNLELVTIGMKTKAGVDAAEKADGITICCGKMFNSLKNLGDKKGELMVLPAPVDMGATHGNIYDKTEKLRYHTAHFNETDGTLKPHPMKIKSKKGAVDELKLVYGYIIPIHGTESNINIDTPTANNDTEFANFFNSTSSTDTHQDADRHPTHSPIDSTRDLSATTLKSVVEGTLTEVALRLKALDEEKNALKRREEAMANREREVACQLKKAEEREQQAEAVYVDVMKKSILLEQERAQASEQFHLAEQKAASVEKTSVEIMEQKADLEDKERHLRDIEVALSQQHLEIEARKQVIATEEARLLEQKARLLNEKSAIEQAKPPIDENATASVVVDEEKKNCAEEVTCMTLEEAEHLTQKVSAAAAAKGREAFVTELQDDVTVEQNIVARYQTRSVTTTIQTSVSPIAKTLRSPTNRKLALKAKKMMKVAKDKGFMHGEQFKIAVERIAAAELAEQDGRLTAK